MTFIIAEVGLAHEGSLGLAFQFVDTAKKVGADGVKFQTHIADEESSISEEFRINFSKQDITRYDYWKRTSFTAEEWYKLAEYCRNKEIEFISSPFSVAAAEILTKCGVSKWKIASGEVLNKPLLDYIALNPLDTIISTGLSSLKDLDSALIKLSNPNYKIYMLHCISKYPTDPIFAGINLISELKQYFGHKIYNVGLSDHSAMKTPSILAVEQGAKVLELHLTLSNSLFGPDIAASHNPESFSDLVREVRFAEICCANKLSFSSKEKSSSEYKILFGRSLAYNKDLSIGHVLSENDFSYLKPGGGFVFEEIDRLIGKKLKTFVQARQLVDKYDFL